MSHLPSYSQNIPLRQAHTSDISPNSSCSLLIPYPQSVLKIPSPIDLHVYSLPDVILDTQQNRERKEKKSSTLVLFYCLMSCVYSYTFFISCVIIDKFLGCVSILVYQIIIMYLS